MSGVYTQYAVGDKLKTWREDEGYTQAEVARMLEVSPQHVTQIENGSRLAGIKTILHIAELIPTTVDNLLREEPEGGDG